MAWPHICLFSSLILVTLPSTAQLVEAFAPGLGESLEPPREASENDTLRHTVTVDHSGWGDWTPARTDRGRQHRSGTDPDLLIRPRSIRMTADAAERPIHRARHVRGPPR
ncbi:hypothetical protein GCM10018775_79440 [Streptomyces umbrinus]|nr:hypothetical protein GCM10018775_79440 [Streptomyces umbrinus]